MKTLHATLLVLGCALALLPSAVAQPANNPARDPGAPKTNGVAPPATEPVPPAQTPVPPPNAPPSPQPAQAPAHDEPPPAPADAVPAEAKPPDASPAGVAAQTPPAPGDTLSSNELRLNFRGAPLDMVLNYLSDAAGFIIVLETDVRGKVDVWSNQPVTKDEAVELLNSVLNKNGYALLRNGRTLTVVSRDEAKKRDIPVKSGSDPANIPRNDEIVTQVLPIRYLNATQISRDLKPLLPDKAELAANEGGNALVITDTQANIRRMAEIIQALDTALSSVSRVRVFPLQYADAKSLANVIKELFQGQQDTSRNNQGPGRFFNFFRGRGGDGGPGGFPPGLNPGGDAGGAQGGASGGNGRAPTPRVSAVADERSNSVIVSAPEEQMPIVEDLIAQVDKNVEDITELRVFHLRFADPQETADLLSNLFADANSSNNQGNRTQVQFGGRFGGRFGGGPFGAAGRATANSGADQSTRMAKQSRVIAVADLRTGSVVVSAARDLLDQIAKMIEELDSDPAKKQKVFVFSLENTDPQAVQDVLQSLFPSQNTGTSGNYGNTRNNSRQTGNQLNNRATQMQNQGAGRNTGFGSSGVSGNRSGFGNN